MQKSTTLGRATPNQHQAQMAALRYAARRLSERALQRAQGSSPVVAQEQRRLLPHGTSTGRRSMSTSSINGKSKTTAGPQDELKIQFENKKEELFDLLLEVRRTEAYRPLSWEDFQTHRLVTLLSAQVEPKPHDPFWRRYRGTMKLKNFIAIYYCLGFHFFVYFTACDATSKNSEASIVSDGETKND